MSRLFSYFFNSTKNDNGVKSSEIPAASLQSVNRKTTESSYSQPTNSTNSGDCSRPGTASVDESKVNQGEASQQSREFSSSGQSPYRHSSLRESHLSSQQEDFQSPAPNSHLESFARLVHQRKSSCSISVFSDGESSKGAKIVHSPTGGYFGKALSPFTRSDMAEPPANNKPLCFRDAAGKQVKLPTDNLPFPNSNSQTDENGVNKCFNGLGFPMLSSEQEHGSVCVVESLNGRECPSSSSCTISESLRNQLTSLERTEKAESIEGSNSSGPGSDEHMTRSSLLDSRCGHEGENAESEADTKRRIVGVSSPNDAVSAPLNPCPKSIEGESDAPIPNDVPDDQCVPPQPKLPQIDPGEECSRSTSSCMEVPANIVAGEKNVLRVGDDMDSNPSSQFDLISRSVSANGNDTSQLSLPQSIPASVRSVSVCSLLGCPDDAFNSRTSFTEVDEGIRRLSTADNEGNNPQRIDEALPHQHDENTSSDPSLKEEDFNVAREDEKSKIKETPQIESCDPGTPYAARGEKRPDISRVEDSPEAALWSRGTPESVTETDKQLGFEDASGSTNSPAPDEVPCPAQSGNTTRAVNPSNDTDPQEERLQKDPSNSASVLPGLCNSDSDSELEAAEQVRDEDAKSDKASPSKQGRSEAILTATGKSDEHETNEQLPTQGNGEDSDVKCSEECNAEFSASTSKTAACAAESDSLTEEASKSWDDSRSGEVPNTSTTGWSNIDSQSIVCEQPGPERSSAPEVAQNDDNTIGTEDPSNIEMPDFSPVCSTPAAIPTASLMNSSGDDCIMVNEHGCEIKREILANGLSAGLDGIGNSEPKDCVVAENDISNDIENVKDNVYNPDHCDGPSTDRTECECFDDTNNQREAFAGTEDVLNSKAESVTEPSVIGLVSDSNANPQPAIVQRKISNSDYFSSVQGSLNYSTPFSGSPVAAAHGESEKKENESSPHCLPDQKESSLQDSSSKTTPNEESSPSRFPVVEGLTLTVVAPKESGPHTAGSPLASSSCDEPGSEEERAEYLDEEAVISHNDDETIQSPVVAEESGAAAVENEENNSPDRSADVLEEPVSHADEHKGSGAESSLLSRPESSAVDGDVIPDVNEETRPVSDAQPADQEVETKGSIAADSEKEDPGCLNVKNNYNADCLADPTIDLPGSPAEGKRMLELEPLEDSSADGNSPKSQDSDGSPESRPTVGLPDNAQKAVATDAGNSGIPDNEVTEDSREQITRDSDSSGTEDTVDAQATVQPSSTESVVEVVVDDSKTESPTAPEKNINNNQPAPCDENLNIKCDKEKLPTNFSAASHPPGRSQPSNSNQSSSSDIRPGGPGTNFLRRDYVPASPGETFNRKPLVSPTGRPQNNFSALGTSQIRSGLANQTDPSSHSFAGSGTFLGGSNNNFNLGPTVTNVVSGVMYWFGAKSAASSAPSAKQPEINSRNANLAAAYVPALAIDTAMVGSTPVVKGSIVSSRSPTARSVNSSYDRPKMSPALEALDKAPFEMEGRCFDSRSTKKEEDIGPLSGNNFKVNSLDHESGVPIKPQDEATAVKQSGEGETGQQGDEHEVVTSKPDHEPTCVPVDDKGKLEDVEQKESRDKCKKNQHDESIVNAGTSTNVVSRNPKAGLPTLNLHSVQNSVANPPAMRLRATVSLDEKIAHLDERTARAKWLASKGSSPLRYRQPMSPRRVSQAITPLFKRDNVAPEQAVAKEVPNRVLGQQATGPGLSSFQNIVMPLFQEASERVMSHLSSLSSSSCSSNDRDDSRSKQLSVVNEIPVLQSGPTVDPVAQAVSAEEMEQQPPPERKKKARESVGYGALKTSLRKDMESPQEVGRAERAKRRNRIEGESPDLSTGSVKDRAKLFEPQKAPVSECIKARPAEKKLKDDLYSSPMSSKSASNEENSESPKSASIYSSKESFVETEAQSAHQKVSGVESQGKTASPAREQPKRAEAEISTLDSVSPIYLSPVEPVATESRAAKSVGADAGGISVGCFPRESISQPRSLVDKQTATSPVKEVSAENEKSVEMSASTETHIDSQAKSVNVKVESRKSKKKSSVDRKAKITDESSPSPVKKMPKKSPKKELQPEITGTTEVTIVVSHAATVSQPPTTLNLNADRTSLTGTSPTSKSPEKLSKETSSESPCQNKPKNIVPPLNIGMDILGLARAHGSGKVSPKGVTSSRVLPCASPTPCHLEPSPLVAEKSDQPLLKDFKSKLSSCVAVKVRLHRDGTEKEKFMEISGVVNTAELFDLKRAHPDLVHWDVGSSSAAAQYGFSFVVTSLATRKRTFCKASNKALRIKGVTVGETFNVEAKLYVSLICPENVKPSYTVPICRRILQFTWTDNGPTNKNSKFELLDFTYRSPPQSVSSSKESNLVVSSLNGKRTDETSQLRKFPLASPSSPLVSVQTRDDALRSYPNSGAVPAMSPTNASSPLSSKERRMAVPSQHSRDKKVREPSRERGLRMPVRPPVPKSPDDDYMWFKIRLASDIPETLLKFGINEEHYSTVITEFLQHHSLKSIIKRPFIKRLQIARELVLEDRSDLSVREKWSNVLKAHPEQNRPVDIFDLVMEV